MRYFIFRNTTIENLFGTEDFVYSGYGDILSFDSTVDSYIWFYILPFDYSRQQMIAETESYFNKIQLIYNQIPKNKTFLIFSLQDLRRVKFQNSDFSLERTINIFNEQLIQLASKNGNVKIIDFSDFTRIYTAEQLIDWKYYFVAKMQINPRLSKHFREWFRKQMDAVQYRRKKCLVVDLDNTLWKGILGEDGMNGIKMSGDYPGNAFSMFQENIIDLGKSGIILTVCSKNNEQDVIDLWQNNPYIKLTKEHLAAYRINWKNKAVNIKDLARELNIGLDSMVFVDDNPSERELVKQLLPDVIVPDFPEQPYLLPAFFDILCRQYFSIYSLTEEDLSKTEQYKANAQRVQLQSNFSDLTDYLKSLEIVITIEEANPFNIPRIAQLTQKTNQFNLTTRRYNETDIINFMNRNDAVYCISVRDKFGNDSITGVIILKRLNIDEAEIDSLLLSCRILGKGIENVFLNYVLSQQKKQDIKCIKAKYIYTPKNMQTRNFYEESGFILIHENGKEKEYCLDLQNTYINRESYLKIEVK